MIITKSNENYFINEQAISFTENDLESPNRIGISITSGTVIMVHIKGTIDFAADGNYQKWVLKGFSTKLATNNPYYLYARLERSSQTGMLVFSVNHYNVNGEIIAEVTPDGNEVTNGTPSDTYYYVKIGSLTETNGTSLRELSYDSGLLGTKKAEQAASTKLEEMFELNKLSTPWLIEVNQFFRKFTVKESITLLGNLIFGSNLHLACTTKLFNLYCLTKLIVCCLTDILSNHLFVETQNISSTTCEINTISKAFGKHETKTNNADDCRSCKGFLACCQEVEVGVLQEILCNTSLKFDILVLSKTSLKYKSCNED